MTKPVPRSRLNITYRTRIDGVPVKQKLPFRLLVLGDFSGGHAGKLESRQIHSILSGMRVDSFMEELGITAPIEDPELATSLIGTLTGSVTGVVKKELPDGKAMVRLTGTAMVRGERAQNGLGNFQGEVSVSGDVEVPLQNEKVTIVSPKLNAYGKMSGDIAGTVSCTFTCDFAKGPIDVDRIESELSASVPVRLTIPVHSLKSFSPEFLAANVPEIRRLILLRRLILEMRAFISNRVELREDFKTVLQHSDLPALREWLIQSYPQLLIERKAASPAAASPPPASGGRSPGSPITPAPPPKSSSPSSSPSSPQS